MARPSDAPDGWWLAVVWVADDDGVVSFRDVAPDAGPPPDPPLGRLGPASRRAVRADPRGRRPAPDAPRADRPARRPDPAVARRRWRSGPRSGSSPRGPRRCARTSSPRPSSPAFRPGRRGPPPALSRYRRVDSARRCATCSTTSWRSSAGARRRHAARIPTRPASARPRRPTDDDDDRDDDERRRADDDDGDDATTEDDADRRRPTADRPQPIARRRRGRGGRRRRGAGRPDDGGGHGRVGRPGRRIASRSSSLVRALHAVVGIDLWTDALWFQSVGFDAVFWTRLGAQARAVRRRRSCSPLVVLLGNLWLAGRLAPPPADRRRRIAPVARRPDQRGRPGSRRPARPARSAFGGGRGRFGDEPTADRLRGRRHARPDAARRLGRSAGSRCSSRCIIGGSCRGAWETVLLWMHRVPFSPDRDRGHRPDLRPRHRLLPVRAAVPAPRPGPVQRHRHRRRCSLVAGPLPRRRVARRARLLDPGPRPPRRPRRAVPAVGRVRLPARQARARRTAPAASRPASASPTRTPSSSPSTS